MIEEEPAAAGPAPSTFPARLSLWIQRHDESWLFIGLYVSLAVILTIAISLFWLVVLVAVHFALEWHKFSKMIPGNRLLVATESFWAVLLDVGLVLFALALTLYMDLIFGVLGLSVGARAGAQSAARVGARFAGWQNVFRGVILALDDAVHIGKALKAGAGRGAGTSSSPAFQGSSWKARWSLGDHLCFWFTVSCLALILLAPLFMGYEPTQVYQILARELRPFP